VPIGGVPTGLYDAKFAACQCCMIDSAVDAMSGDFANQALVALYQQPLRNQRDG
jgi:hypothetical protein